MCGIGFLDKEPSYPQTFKQFLLISCLRIVIQWGNIKNSWVLDLMLRLVLLESVTTFLQSKKKRLTLN